MRKALILILTLVLCLSMYTPAFAKEGLTVSSGLTRTVSERCYIDTEGSLWMWGENNYGQCGVDPKETQWLDEPRLVMTGVAQVYRQKEAVIVLKIDGTAWTWGYDFNHGASVRRKYSDGKVLYDYAKGPEPYKVADNVAAVSLGNQMQFGILKTDGTLWTWGNPIWNDLGYATSIVPSPGQVEPALPLSYFKVPADSVDMMGFTPSVPVKLMDDVKAFAMGHYDGAAIKNDGSMWYWGNDDSVAMKNNKQTGGEPMAPTKIMDNVASFSLDDEWCEVVTGSGELWTIGRNLGTQLNTRKKIADNVKIVAGSYTDLIELSKHSPQNQVKYSFDYVLKKDGKLYGKNGSEFIMDNVVWVDVCNDSGSFGIAPADARCYQSAYILCSDGVLYERKPVYSVLENGFKDQFLGRYEIVKLADNVAMPGQPFSSLRPKVKPFTDVFKDDYYGEAVKWAVESGVTDGVSADKFAPERTVTRGQAVTFLWRAMGEPDPETETNPFDDVDAGSYYYKAVLWAFENGITDGTGPALFSPDSAVKRGQMITFLWRTMGEPGKTGDKEGKQWYTDPENWANKKDMLSGTRTAYTTSGACPRGDVVYYLWEALEKLQ